MVRRGLIGWVKAEKNSGLPQKNIIIAACR
jgi:hypothetical protein